MLDYAEDVVRVARRQRLADDFSQPSCDWREEGRAKQTATARAWSAGEQSLAQKASEQTQAVLAAANEAYEATFGHVFLICATGKTSEEILKHLQERLANDAETEMRIAGEEQRKITRLRLEKLLQS